jgi:hypothetical protein
VTCGHFLLRKTIENGASPEKPQAAKDVRHFRNHNNYYTMPALWPVTFLFFCSLGVRKFSGTGRNDNNRPR